MLNEGEMMADRKRINVSLSDQEYSNLEMISSYLGTKPTKLLYMSYMEGLPIIYQKNAALINQTTITKNEANRSKKKK